MSASARVSRALALALCLLVPAIAGAGTPPLRVVSINLCTDQLAMALAAPGQLVSVSYLSADPRMSMMADRAAAYPLNHAGAEEVYLMRPDLVLGGIYTNRGSVEILQRLGVPVLLLPPVDRLEDVAAQMRTVGAALGRTAEAEAQVAAFEAALAALRVDLPPVTAAQYHPNGYTTGTGTLADEIMRHTGYANIAARAGVAGGGVLALERLVMEDPQVIVTARPWPGASRSEELLVHPALAALRARAAQVPLADAGWSCGTPAMLAAVAGMAAARRAMEGR
ncbi:ABC transporter substrate-binding protein [Xinfangfangia sp. LG-4]|uniref:ABC transporter substrate-binding protein n=1 Tax=Ruixingdingia sedimenti TaxID=3073604 RepID=A0ABU1FCB3_9RHOB|nr:ABC transporter substrate-binding protein [Xinfangfangia sp. LG-4]